MFLQECPRLLEGVRKASALRNPALLERAAHSLKGSVGDVAAPQAWESARVLEEMARGGDLAGADDVVTKLEATLDQLGRELRNTMMKVT